MLSINKSQMRARRWVHNLGGGDAILFGGFETCCTNQRGGRNVAQPLQLASTATTCFSCFGVSWTGTSCFYFRYRKDCTKETFVGKT